MHAKQSTYRPQLDSLRCFAVIGVLITHFVQPDPFPWIFHNVDLGFLGVRLFFVLSGFLITRILLDCRDTADQNGRGALAMIRQFYARRALRIFPVYYLIVSAAILVDLPPARDAWPWLLTYTSNVYQAAYGGDVGYFGHFWTLAVEEQFYLVWPWLVLFVPRRRLGAILAFAIALTPVARDITFRLFGENGWGTMPWVSLDTLGVGSMLALAYHDARTREALHQSLNRVILPLGIGAYLALHAITVSGNMRLLAAFHEIAYAMICCWLIASADRGFGGLAGRALSLRPIVYLGRISYGIYAYHMFMPWLLGGIARRLGIGFPQPGWTRFALAGAATLAVAVISWHLFERPINDLKRHFPYRFRTSRPTPFPRPPKPARTR
jgi:peptidoglycan/LPS O-acetylase OafA/YrhL